MGCADYNPNPPRPPFWPRPERVYSFSPEDPDTMHFQFLDFYHRSWARYTFQTRPDGTTVMVPRPPPDEADSVIIGSGYIDAIRADANMRQVERSIEGRLRTRALQYLRTLDCGRKGCFKDAGYELVPTESYSVESWALGHFSIYWQAQCDVGPRACNVQLPECDSGVGSTADYTCTIKYTLYDIFDFTGWQNVIPLGWTGTAFHIFGEWDSTANGTLKVCEEPPAPCQDDLRISVEYPITFAMLSTEQPCGKPDMESVTDSAMGRLLEDGKEWCSTGRCTEGTCSPFFSEVAAELMDVREEPVGERTKKCIAVVKVTAVISCRCAGELEVPFPSPG